MKFNVFISVFIFLIGQLTFASEVKVEGRSYHQFCGSFSQTVADFKISYKNLDIPWGSKVFIQSGMNGIVYYGQQSSEVVWKNQTEVELPATDEYTWSSFFEKVVHHRTGDTFFKAFVFVFRIELPNGDMIFDNGLSKPWSYYLVKVPSAYIQCVTEDLSLPQLTPLDVSTVESGH